tara:strand:- start:1146 stop:1304 length:159 start_codon:yes stop_codon:yes gene_type:complete
MHLKVLLFIPILLCKKKIGPLEVNFMIRDNNKNKGSKAIKTKIANNLSKNVL